MSTLPTLPNTSPTTETILNEIREIQKALVSVQTQINDVKKSLQDEIHAVRTEFLDFQIRANQLDDVYTWSQKVREVITIQELERIRNEVNELSNFKVKVTALFAAAQAITAAVVAYITK